MSHWFNQLFNESISIRGHSITYREIIGNLFGLVSALGGLRRRVWAWPVGIVGNVLLFTVFLGVAFGTPGSANLYGQAARQVFFVLASGYGWWRWRENKRSGSGAPAVTPRWATSRERSIYLPLAAAGVLICFAIFHRVGSGAYFHPKWWYYLIDSWIFIGSMLATYAMARGWVDFWLVWICVDLVGVPELFYFKLYPSAAMFIVYGALVIWGFFVWLKISRDEQPQGLADPAMETVA
jgi:nicotinamide mononucleotide transporter